MRGIEFLTLGVAAIVAGVMVAFTPLVNILVGWWLAPLLVIGGTMAIFAGLAFSIVEFLRKAMRFLVCQVFREEEAGRPAIHHFVLNTGIWQMLGGGHCHPFLQARQ